MKTCKTCGNKKPFSDFYQEPRNKDGHSGTCRECNAAKTKAWRGKDQERARESSKASSKRYNDAHPEVNRRYKDKIKATNPGQITEQKRRNLQRQREEMRDGYVRRLLVQDGTITRAQVTPELIEAMRMRLTAQRLADQLRKGASNESQ